MIEENEFRFEISACQLTKIAYFHFCERKKNRNLLFCVNGILVASSLFEADTVQFVLFSDKRTAN